MNPVRFDKVNFDYDDTPILEDVSFSVDAGEFFGLIGPNAAGKSTLLRLILGLLAPRTGRVTVFDRSPEDSRARVGYVPQFPTFARDFPISVKEMVLMGRLGLGRITGPYSQADRKHVWRALEAVEAAQLADRPLYALSGGQLQRVMIARALVCEPELLILDEPTANIDLRAEEDIFALLRDYNERMTIIVVSHDIAFISSYVNRVGCLNRTLVCHRTGDISGATIEQLYGMPVRMIQHAH